MGSASGGRAAAIAYTLIETARLNEIDPQAWLAQILDRILDCKINRIDDLLPWNTAPAAPSRTGRLRELYQDASNSWPIRARLSSAAWRVASRRST